MKIFLIIFIIITHSAQAAWKDIDCSVMKKNMSFEHLDYNLNSQSCSQNLGNPVSRNIQYYDGPTYIYIDAQRAQNPWADAYDTELLTKEYLEQVVIDYNLGQLTKLDPKPSNIITNKRRYYYKTYETTDGIGFFSSSQLGKNISRVVFINENKSYNITEDFIQSIHDSIFIKGYKKSSPTNVSLGKSNSSTNNTSESTSQTSTKSDENNEDDFDKFCKNSKLGDLEKDIAALCLEKMK